MSLLAGRAIAADADHPIGPDPIAASAREATREQRHPGPGTPTIDCYAASFAAIFATVGWAWSNELRRPLGRPLDAGAFWALLRRLDGTDGAAMILRDLSAILDRIGSAATEPLSASDLDQLEHGARTILDLLGRIATVPSDEEAAAILEAVS